MAGRIGVHRDQRGSGCGRDRRIRVRLERCEISRIADMESAAICGYSYTCALPELGISDLAVADASIGPSAVLFRRVSTASAFMAPTDRRGVDAIR